MLVNFICRPLFHITKMKAHILFIPIFWTGRPISLDKNLISLSKGVFGICFPYEFTRICPCLIELMFPRN